MSIGTQIAAIRKEQKLTQEEFGKLFHVTRQTVSNWENEKSYPDLQILIGISNQFEISLDLLLKGDAQMVKTIDRERLAGSMKRKKSIIDFFTGSGTGIIASCLFSPVSGARTAMMTVGFLAICIGWYKNEAFHREVFHYIAEKGRACSD